MQNHRMRAANDTGVNALLDTVGLKLGAKNDAALCRLLDVAPPVVSKIRHYRMAIGPTLLIRMHEQTGMSIVELKNFLLPSEMDTVMEPKRTPMRQPDEEAQAKMAAAMAAQRRERDERQQQMPAIRLEGEAALRRLVPVAQRDTGQSSVIARFLLNLYNGERFPFDLTDLRRLDYSLFDDCIAVLKMDAQPLKEVHRYFDDGGAMWEAMAKDWGFKDYAGAEWR